MIEPGSVPANLLRRPPAITALPDSAARILRVSFPIPDKPEVIQIGERLQRALAAERTISGDCEKRFGSVLVRKIK